jgi:hypothetical protein
VFIVYGSVANNMNSAGLQFIIIKLDKDSFSLPEAYADYSNIFNSGKAVKLQTQTHTTYTINLENKAKAPYCHNLLGCIAACTSGCRRGVYCNRKHGFSTAVIDRRGGNSMN